MDSYTLMNCYKIQKIPELLSQIDILVDGRFELSKRDPKLQFRGSSNQRIIDVQKSLESNQVVIWEKCTDATETYEQIKSKT